MIKIVLFSLLQLITFNLLAAKAARPVKLYTEEFPPYNYKDGSKVVGVSVDIVENMFYKAKINFSNLL